MLPLLLCYIPEFLPMPCMRLCIYGRVELMDSEQLLGVQNYSPLESILSDYNWQFGIMLRCTISSSTAYNQEFLILRLSL
jgi:hypothetical protein